MPATIHWVAMQADRDQDDSKSNKTGKRERGGRPGYDGGWCLHAVVVLASDRHSKLWLKDKPSLCGMLPEQGWDRSGLIADRCPRCAALAGLHMVPDWKSMKQAVKGSSAGKAT